MPTDLHDDLIARLRAADPATGLVADDASDRAAVDAARRRRSNRRTLRLGGGGALVAGAATVALALGPAGGGVVTGVAPAPAVAQVVERAAEATRLAGASIVAIESEVHVRTNLGQFTQSRTAWVRLDDRGRQLELRSLITAARGRDVAAGAEDVMSRNGDGTTTLASFDPATRRITTTPGGSMEPTAVFQAERLLSLAQRGERDVRIDRTETIGGRRAHVLVFTGVDEPAIDGDHSELAIDAETYAPLLLRKHSEGIAVNGRPFTYDYSERVVSREVLPDDEANRALLRMHGPTG